MVKVDIRSNGKQVLVRTPEDDKNNFSFLEIIDRVDKFPQDFSQIKSFQDNVYYLTTHDDIKVGFVFQFVIDQLKALVPSNLLDATFTLNEISHQLIFKSSDFETRNKQIDEIGLILHESSECKLEALKAWRNEKYAIWIKQTPYVLIERALSGPFGIITHGSHINGYVTDPVTQEVKFWIPRRSATKPTWPLMLDNIIAGGLGYPYGPYETAIKESLEEANLEKEIIEKYIESAGVVTYFHYAGDASKDNFDSEGSYIVGEAEFIYDLHLPHDIIPRPNDGEVDSFNLMTLEQTIHALQNKEFKPNCGLVMIDFLIRNGYINAENEPNFITISNKMHRHLPFPTIASV
ncbi:hypothetical protein MOUN0_G00650 [Monosporozyma unispora]|nr:hypothetical protein C6P44_001315 [Kazachstania unispora]